MPQQVQGVVARSKGAPVELAEINNPDPGSPALAPARPFRPAPRSNCLVQFKIARDGPR